MILSNDELFVVFAPEKPFKAIFGQITQIRQRTIATRVGFQPLPPLLLLQMYGKKMKLPNNSSKKVTIFFTFFLTCCKSSVCNGVFQSSRKNAYFLHIYAVFCIFMQFSFTSNENAYFLHIYAVFCIFMQFLKMSKKALFCSKRRKNKSATNLVF